MNTTSAADSPQKFSRSRVVLVKRDASFSQILWASRQLLLFVLLSLAASLSACSAAQTPSAATQTPSPATQTPSATSEQPEKRIQQQVFDELWQIIDQNYVYEDFNGVDWEAIRLIYQEKLDAGLTDEAFWTAMSEMVSLLGDDHSRFLTPAETAERDQLHSGEFNFVGVGIYFHAMPEKGYGVVLFPFAGGPADQAGIRAHDRLIAVDGVPFCCDQNDEPRVDLVLGPEGTEVILTVQTPGGPPREETIVRAPVQADFPVISRRLENDIGYILVPLFEAEDVAEKTQAAWLELTEAGALNGLVLDLRTSRGGRGSELEGILALFVDGEMGNFLSRKETRPLRIRGRDVAGSQSVPLVILVGGITESFAEVMAGVMQEAGRAVLVGSATAGNVEAVWGHDFADGSGAWIAQETFVPPSGANWEQTGVIPDVEIVLGWDEFAGQEADLVLNRALELLAGE